MLRKHFMWRLSKQSYVYFGVKSIACVVRLAWLRTFEEKKTKKTKASPVTTHDWISRPLRLRGTDRDVKFFLKANSLADYKTTDGAVVFQCVFMEPAKTKQESGVSCVSHCLKPSCTRDKKVYKLRTGPANNMIVPGGLWLLPLLCAM